MDSTPKTGKKASGELPVAPRILVVEDDSAVLQVLCEQLTELGYAVETAADGEIALMRLRLRSDIDLILLDLDLPRMSGRELIGVLSAGGSRVPIVVMTGTDHATDRIYLKRLQVAATLAKPFGLKVLAKAVSDVLKPLKAGAKRPSKGRKTTGPHKLHG